MSLFFFFTGPGDPRDLPVLTHPFPTRRSSDLLTGRRRCLSLDDDPTSTSKGTSGFGAYALSGESVDVVVGVWIFAAGFTRKATPSACARRFRNPRRSQCTPGNVDLAWRIDRKSTRLNSSH